MIVHTMIAISRRKNLKRDIRFFFFFFFFAPKFPRIEW